MRWAESVKKTRVNDLFRTLGGLAGHVQQVEQEVSRVISDKNMARKMEGMSGDNVTDLFAAVKSVQDAIVAAAKGANFDFPKFSVNLGNGSVMYLERTNGQLKRDGKPA